MERLRTPAAMRAWADARRAEGARIGLVPTMGYLHEGHVSLVRVAKGAGSEAVAATIFVNPTQFGPGEDFEKYPRDEARDLAMLDAAGVDAVYLPGVRDMYPEGHQTFVDVTGFRRGCAARRGPDTSAASPRWWRSCSSRRSPMWRSSGRRIASSWP